MTSAKKYTGLLGWLALSALAGVIASLFEPGDWYAQLAKPGFTPPNILFPIVWPILYAMMGTAAWIIWKNYGFDGASRALKWYGVQLALNTAWSWLFFGRQYIATALAEIALLWVAILFTLFLFWHKDRRAGMLLIPYLLWISYALALNYAIWQMN